VCAMFSLSFFPGLSSSCPFSPKFNMIETSR
jgi:hypothetical protein